MRLFRSLLDLLAPPFCIECGDSKGLHHGPFCEKCNRALAWWRRADGCPRCGSALPNISAEGWNSIGPLPEGCPGCFAEGSAIHACHTALRYEGPVRRWVPGFKNAASPFGPSTITRLAIEYLATTLASRLASETITRPDLLVSIPLHRSRKIRRGFNHVDPLTRQISLTLGVPWSGTALIRVRNTATQASLVGRARQNNMRGAFRLSEGRGSLRTSMVSRIWLVDDVLTTGSTLNAAAEVLLEGGCEEVRALTLAATLPTRRSAPRKEAAYHTSPSSAHSARPSRTSQCETN